MRPEQREKLQRTADHYNEKAMKDGSDFRLLVTDDRSNPFILVNLLENTSMPGRFREEYVRASKN